MKDSIIILSFAAICLIGVNIIMIFTITDHQARIEALEAHIEGMDK